MTNWLSPSIGQPQLNHQYEFDITQSVVGGLNYWTLTIKDLTAGTSMSRNITRNYSSANEVWYGIEVWTEADQFGGPSSSSPVQVTDMEYMDTSLAWSYVTYDNSNPCSSANGYRASYWQCWSSNDLNTHHSILTGYTVNH